MIDLSPATLHPIALPYFDNEVAFVVGETEDGNQVGALVQLTARGKKPAGAIVYKLGPASHVDLVDKRVAWEAEQRQKLLKQQRAAAEHCDTVRRISSSVRGTKSPGAPSPASLLSK